MPDTFATLVDADLDGWRRTFDVNVFGTLGMTQAVAKHMETQGHGSIIFVNTVGIWVGPARQGAYIGSKAALLALAQVLASELGPHGIRVNSVAPGWMLGPPVRNLLEGRAARNGTTFQIEYDKIASEIPIGRIPTDADCAGVIVFLASDLSERGHDWAMRRRERWTGVPLALALAVQSCLSPRRQGPGLGWPAAGRRRTA